MQRSTSELFTSIESHTSHICGSNVKSVLRKNVKHANCACFKEEFVRRIPPPIPLDGLNLHDIPPLPPKHPIIISESQDVPSSSIFQIFHPQSLSRPPFQRSIYPPDDLDLNGKDVYESINDSHISSNGSYLLKSNSQKPTMCGVQKFHPGNAEAHLEFRLPPLSLESLTNYNLKHLSLRENHAPTTHFSTSLSNPSKPNLLICTCHLGNPIKTKNSSNGIEKNNKTILFNSKPISSLNTFKNNLNTDTPYLTSTVNNTFTTSRQYNRPIVSSVQSCYGTQPRVITNDLTTRNLLNTTSNNVDLVHENNSNSTATWFSRTLNKIFHSKSPTLRKNRQRLQSKGIQFSDCHDNQVTCQRKRSNFKPLSACKCSYIENQLTNTTDNLIVQHVHHVHHVYHHVHHRIPLEEQPDITLNRTTKEDTYSLTAFANTFPSSIKSNEMVSTQPLANVLTTKEICNTCEVPKVTKAVQSTSSIPTPIMSHTYSAYGARAQTTNTVTTCSSVPLNKNTDLTKTTINQKSKCVCCANQRSSQFHIKELQCIQPHDSEIAVAEEKGAAVAAVIFNKSIDPINRCSNLPWTPDLCDTQSSLYCPQPMRSKTLPTSSSQKLAHRHVQHHMHHHHHVHHITSHSPHRDTSPLSLGSNTTRRRNFIVRPPSAPISTSRTCQSPKVVKEILEPTSVALHGGCESESTIINVTPICKSNIINHRFSFKESMKALRKMGWYWGPLSFTDAEILLTKRPDGTFLVRDSGHDTFFLSLSFRVRGTTYHTRIEHNQGRFSFWSQPQSHSASTVVEFIEKAVAHSIAGKFHYFLQTSTQDQQPVEVPLLYPLSRFQMVQSLKHLSRFTVLSHVRQDHIAKLPLPPGVIGYLLEKQVYWESLEEFEEAIRDRPPLRFASCLARSVKALTPQLNLSTLSVDSVSFSPPPSPIPTLTATLPIFTSDNNLF